MAVLAPSRRVQVLIGSDNQDWSVAFDSISMGDPERDDSGLLLATGKLVLKQIDNPPESMNPRTGTGRLRFARGQQVIINCTDDSGNLMRFPRGWCYIASPPLPPYPDKPYLEIELICGLGLRRFPQPRGGLLDRPIPVGPSLPLPKLDRNGLIVKCLQLAGVPNTTSLAIGKYPVDQAVFHDSGDGYTAYAGEIAYGGIAALWQNNQGQVVNVSLAITPTAPIATVVIGQDEALYEPIDGGETPVEKVIYQGNVPTLKPADPGEDEESSNFTITKEYGPAAMVDASLGTGDILVRVTQTLNGTSGNKKFSRTVILEPGGLVSRTAFPKQTGLRLSADKQQNHYYGSDGRLQYIEEIEKQLFCKLCETYFSTLDAAGQAALAATEVYRRKYTYHNYDSKQRTTSIQSTTYEPLAAVVTDEELTEPTADTVTETDNTSYAEVRKGEWQQVHVVRKSLIRVAPSLDFGESDQEDNLTAAKAGLRTSLFEVLNSNGGQAGPPATETKPNTLETEDRPIQGSAAFEVASLGFQERERTYDLPVLCTGVDQLQELAQIQGALLIGRAQGARIKLPLTQAFLDNPTPFQTLAVIETESLTSGVRQNLVYYQMDGTEYVIESSTAYVLASLIWLGTIEGAIVPHGDTPDQPVFDEAELEAPYQSVALDYVGDAANDGTPDLVVIAPPILIRSAYLGLGLGLSAELPFTSRNDPKSAEIGLGIGLLTDYIEAIAANVGIGLGLQGNLVLRPLVGEVGVGVGLQSDLIIADIGLGLGVEAFLPKPPILADLGLGVGVAGELIYPDLVGEVGVGVGLQSDLIIADIGLGLGIQGELPLIDLNAEIGVGLGFADSREPMILVGNTGVGLGGEAGKLPIIITSSLGLGVGIEADTSNLANETTTLLAALTGTYSNADQTAINTLIVGLKNDQIWSKLDVLYLMAAKNSADAQVNWKNPGTYNATQVGSLTFTTDRGFKGWSESNYLDTTFNPSTAGGNYSQNSASIGVYNRVNGNDSALFAIGSLGGGNFARFSLNNSGSAVALINANSNVFPSTSNAQGLTTVTRTASNAQAYYRNSSSLSSGTQASTGVPTETFFIGCQNAGFASSATNTNFEFALAFIGSGLSGTDVSNLSSHITTYLTYLGANV